MRSLPTLFVLLTAVLLGVAGCTGCGGGPEITTRPCPASIEQLTYAADACDPASVVLRDWDCTAPLPLTDWPAGDCFGKRSRLVRLAPPAGGTVVLTFYNASRGALTYQLVTRRGGALEPLTDCRTETGVVLRTEAAVPPGADSLYLRLEAGPDGSDQRDVDRLLRERSYVEITAHDGLPEVPRITDRAGLLELAGADTPCAGSYTGRLVVTTCGPDVDLANWAAELGLEIEGIRTGADGSSIGVVILPDAAGNPRKAQDAVADGDKPDVNNDSIVVEADIRFAIREPVDVFYPDVNPQQTGDFSVTAYRDCVSFTPAAARSAPSNPGVRVAIIDSGVDSLGPFGDRFLANPFTDGRLGYDYKSGTGQPTDSLGHGTSVAGIVLGRYRGDAPLGLLHQKIFDGNGVATYYGALVAIQDAIDAEVDIINASWGLSASAPRQALICALERAGEAGIYVVTSAGNDRHHLDARPQYPAALAGTPGFEHLVTVASFGPYVYSPDPRDHSPSYYSNYSTTHATLAAFATAQTPRLLPSGDWVLGYPTGTSFSTPLVTAALATYLGRGHDRPLDLLADALEVSNRLDTTTVGGRYLSVCYRAEEE